MKWLRLVPLRKAIVLALLLAATFSVGWYASRYLTLKEVTRNTMQPVRYKDPAYPLINPLVSIAIPNSTGFDELNGLENDIRQVIALAKKSGAVSDVGVYFRLPANAHWFG